MSIIGVGQQPSIFQIWQLLGTTPTPPTSSTDASGDASGAVQSTDGSSGSQNTSGTSTGGTSLIQQLETAIQNALSGVSSTQSNNPQDVLTSIEQAIQTTLQNNGIDPNQLSQTGGHHHHHHHGGDDSGGAGGGTTNAILSVTAPGGSTGTGDASSNGTTDSSTGDASSNTSQTPGLDFLLGQLNVDPQQFQNDLTSAVSSSQSGTLDLFQVFQSFPVGQNVNTLA